MLPPFPAGSGWFDEVKICDNIKQNLEANVKKNFPAIEEPSGRSTSNAMTSGSFALFYKNHPTGAGAALMPGLFFLVV